MFESNSTYVRSTEYKPHHHLGLFKFAKDCVTTKLFLFQQQLYKQTSGLVMGSPLSPLLAEIFMTHLEREILQTQDAIRHIKF